MNRWLTRLLGVQRGEAGAVLAGFLMLFFLFTLAVLQPVRETTACQQCGDPARRFRGLRHHVASVPAFG